MGPVNPMGGGASGGTPAIGGRVRWYSTPRTHKSPRIRGFRHKKNMGPDFFEQEVRK